MVCQISLYSVFQCEECSKEIKPKYSMRIHEGKFYCKDCHWELFGREEIKKKFQNMFIEE